MYINVNKQSETKKWGGGVKILLIYPFDSDDRDYIEQMLISYSEYYEKYS
jgi:hypothetical protein